MKFTIFAILLFLSSMSFAQKNMTSPKGEVMYHVLKLITMGVLDAENTMLELWQLE